MGFPVIVDELDHRLNGRSSSAWAKYAEALRRISLACRSSRTSRSSAFTLSATSAGTPVVAQRTFDGVIVLDHDPKRLFARLGPLLDVVARPSEQGWRLTPLTREMR
jgi:hypothetical protein